ncbi:alpha/beta fold hydrolase [Croceibacterium salegens]|uniref:alpha/beta fold hydrolase n=1 Tax=Croceibacterium salegens TaxID=1737568 RepID=UPI000AD05681|nr:alpha/beta fold hydrolase [Croceibacterium salegens]
MSERLHKKLSFDRHIVRTLLALAALALASPTPVLAQVETEKPPVVEGAKPVVMERFKVHSPSIEGNLEGNSADRDVIVVLPPSYRASPGRRYPVLYALHGYSIGAEQWIQEIRVPQVVEAAFAKGVPEMIVVLPDSKTLHNGSVYSKSVTTGDFEDFVAKDLVAYVDSHYRTIPRRESRGLVGHSMGGYGATRIGMKHADVFGALYAMSPGGLQGRPMGPYNADVQTAIDGVKTLDQVKDLPFPARGLLALSSAWSPNPNRSPLFLDLPFKDGKPDPGVLERWTANSPFALLDQYAGDLKRYAAIAMDVGDEDGLKSDTEELHKRLLSYGIPNSFELYHGTHTSRVAFRFQDHVLQFFGQHLSFEVPPPPSSPEAAGDKGSGPYPAIMEVDPALPKHVIYRPENLATLKGRKLPLYIWGNGACTDDAASVRNHLLEVASHGYLVMVPGYIGEELARVQAARGQRAPGAPPEVPTTTQDLRDGLDWAIGENSRGGSKYRGLLDTKAVAASGFSCGGVQAIDLASSDPRVTALIVQNSGLFPDDGTPMLPGMDTPKTALAKLNMPVLYIQGGPTDIAWANGRDDYNRLIQLGQVPVAMVGLPTGHGGTYHDPHGGAAAMIAIDWLEWQLRGKQDAARSFLGDNCRICTVPAWTIDRKGF